MDAIRDFYQHQSETLEAIEKVSKWANSIRQVASKDTPLTLETPAVLPKSSRSKRVPTKTSHENGVALQHPNLFLYGAIGSGKSHFIRTFLREKTRFDVLDFGHLVTILEESKQHTTRTFIRDFLQQRNVARFDNVICRKLLLVDSIEESLAVYPTLIREIINNMDDLQMPLVLVGEASFLDGSEKRILTRIKRSFQSVKWPTPNRRTLLEWTRSQIGDNKAERIGPFALEVSSGDMRYYMRLIHFIRLHPGELEETALMMDSEVDVVKAIGEFRSYTLTDAFHKAESDPFVFGMLAYENFVRSKSGDLEGAIYSVCFADEIDRQMFQTQNWALMDYYNFFHTIQPLMLMDPVKSVVSSSTIQRYMNTQKTKRKEWVL